jgi:N-acetylglucosamine repressor
MIKMSQLGNRDLMRAMNRSIILNVIKTKGEIARAEIARQTGLSPATVTAITAELIEDDLVFEKAAGDSSGGRPPILLAVNPSGGYVVGIKLTETHAIGALTDLEANVITKKTILLESQEPSEVVCELALLSTELMVAAGLPQTKLLGVGIGLAGIIDYAQGILRQSPFFSWRDLPLRSLLQAQLHVPVYVDNDVNTLTHAEKWFGSGQGIHNFLVITVGRGIGMGIVINGQFYRGASGGAGEFGHITIEHNGRACSCGKQGCLEALVSEPGLLQTAAIAASNGHLPVVDTIEEFLTLVEQENPTAVQILNDAGKLLGRAIANVVNVLNPKKIILGGEGVRLGDPFFQPMKDEIFNNATAVLTADLQIQVEPWGDDAWARGAASQVLRELFESPVHREAIQVT